MHLSSKTRKDISFAHCGSSPSTLACGAYGLDHKPDSCYFAIYTESSEKLKLSIQGIEPPVICPDSTSQSSKELVFFIVSKNTHSWVLLLEQLVKLQIGEKNTANRKSGAKVQSKRHDVKSTKRQVLGVNARGTCNTGTWWVGTTFPPDSLHLHLQEVKF